MLLYSSSTDTIVDGRAFLNKVINFVGVGIALYTIANMYEWVSSDSIIKHTIKCKYCRKRISEKVNACY